MNITIKDSDDYGHGSQGELKCKMPVVVPLSRSWKPGLLVSRQGDGSTSACAMVFAGARPTWSRAFRRLHPPTEINGVGYRAEVTGSSSTWSLVLPNPVEMVLPAVLREERADIMVTLPGQRVMLTSLMTRAD